MSANQMSRRNFLAGSALLATTQLVQAAPSRTFRIWVLSDSHVGTDKENGRESLADAIRHSESDFDWDIALQLGDLSGAFGVPADPEGEEVVRQYSALRSHKREAIYDLAGNHDRSGLDEPDAWWWQKWADPLGQHTRYSGVDAVRRPYPVEGTWERYSFRVGNLLFLMMSDRNEPSQKIGRGTLGGNPGGVVTAETFGWWKHMIESNRDSNIISAHHYVLKNTTVASGDWEGMRKDANGHWQTYYHGYFEPGTPIGASYLYWVGGKRDSASFESYLAAHPGAVQFWLGGHTHTNPDDTCGGKSHIETKWGTHFMNACALTLYHGTGHDKDGHDHPGRVPMSRLFTLEEGSNMVRVQCYLHTSGFGKQGWYPRAERRLALSQPFQWSA